MSLCLCSAHAKGAPTHLLELDLLFVPFCTKGLLEAFWRLQEQITKHRVSSIWQFKESLEWRKFLFGEKSVQQSSWKSFTLGCLPGLKTFTWCHHDLWLLNSPLKFVVSSKNCLGKPQEQRLETTYSMRIRANEAWASLWIYVLV